MDNIIDIVHYSAGLNFYRNIVFNEILKNVNDLRPSIDNLYKICNYIHEKIRYAPDSSDIEILQMPYITLKYGYGDCDDLSILLSTLLECAGYEIALAIVKVGNDVFFGHIYVYVKIDNQWISCDLTLNDFINYEYPFYNTRRIYLLYDKNYEDTIFFKDDKTEIHYHKFKNKNIFLKSFFLGLFLGILIDN
jgi:hypothetical protein